MPQSYMSPWQPVRRLLAVLVVAQMLLIPAGPGRAQDHVPDQVQDQAAAPVDTPPLAATPPGRERSTADPDHLTPAERHRLRALLDSPAHAAAPARPTAPAAPAAAAAAPAKPKTVSLAPDSLASEVLVQAGTVQREMILQTHAFGRLFGDIALTGYWLQRETIDPRARAAFLDALWRSAAVVLVALAVEHVLLLALRRPLRALSRDARAVEEEHDETDSASELQLAEATLPDPSAPAARLVPPSAARLDAMIPPQAGAAPDPALLAEAAARQASQDETRVRDAAHRRRTLRLFRRLPYALLRLLLKLAPLGVFLAIGNLAATSVAPAPRTQLVIITVTNLYGIGRALWLLLDMLLAARAPGVRLIRITDEHAHFLTRWWGWLVAIPVVVFCISDVGRILDLPTRASLAIQRAVVLVEHILLAVLIWQTRRSVAASLHPPRRLRQRSYGRVLTRLADHWWIVALFFDAALWFVWAAQIRGGYAKMWQLFLSSLIIIFAARITVIMLLGALDRVFRAGPRTELSYPGLERRAGRYYPALRVVITWTLTVVCIIALMQAWGIPVLGFFTHGTLGTHLLSAGITILVTLAVGVLVWELANGALDRQIGRFNDSGQAPRAVRLQTLLPILRTLLFVVLGTIMVLTILSEIGVNIAPLLAGAGIIGVAVGFGSQKLVQDFITGIFLLVENAMQVGDNVTVAGINGIVEHLSIRTLRLRSGDGSIQIIPFSSVTTVANMSRDYAVAAINVSIAFSEDTDRVCELLTTIGQALRTEPPFADMTLADFGLNGVDSLGEYAVAISGTMRCTVAGRWPVQREFNRRLRARFTELGIALPQAHQSILMPGLPALMQPEAGHAAGKEMPAHG